MNEYQMVRAESKKMRKGDLLELPGQQGRKWCIVGARECNFLIRYKSLGFCLTELLGKGCFPQSEPGDAAEENRAEAIHCPAEGVRDSLAQVEK